MGLENDPRLQFDDLVEVFTDKLVAKIPSTCTGVVKEINYKEDDICLVGHNLISIEVEDGSAAPEEPKAAETPASQPA